MAIETRQNPFMNTVRVLLGVFILVTFASFWYVSRQDGYDKQYITFSAELRVLIERLTRVAGESVVEAKKNSFAYLRYRVNEFSVILEILKRGKQDAEGNYLLPPSQSSIQNKELADLARLWEVEKKNAEIILNNQEVVLSAHDIVNNLVSTLRNIRQDYLDMITLLSNRTPAISGNDFVELVQQVVAIQDIETRLRDVLDVNVDTSDLEKQFAARVDAFGKKIQDIKTKYNNDAVLPKILDTERLFVTVKDRTNDIIQTAQTLTKVHGAWLSIMGMIPNFLEYTTNLEKAYSADSDKRLINDTNVQILSAITVLLLILLLYLMYIENRKLQREIKQLVSELKDLGTGNLSVQATTIGVTGAISEAINYALSTLRKLVTSINQTSEKVGSSANSVKRIAEDLNKAITHQTVEIGNATASANAMAESIDRVVSNAKKSAQVAENSVEIAHEGAIVVNNTIEGMERIREQIRKTEKRIRRLGESSQEIGEIVSLIDGISEQTNLLSLNASIQAAMAGDVGLGFAVVADEVQQLAVKSSQATKEVENLVKAIQTDTARAAESMQQAITEVSTGTNLAHDAGKALAKIESVSKNLSELIQNMSTSAEEQAIVANRISKMMEIIESIAQQTATGTTSTAESIGDLAHLVQELRSSVAEFKLPT